MWKMMAKGSVGLRVREVSPQNSMWHSEGWAAVPGWAAGGWEGEQAGMRARAGSELPVSPGKGSAPYSEALGAFKGFKWGDKTAGFSV